MYICKVCGYNNLEKPQYYEDNTPSFVLCDCCGFESGFDDLDQGYTYKSYREKWLSEGAKWFSKNKPEQWDLKEQLKNIGFYL